MVDAGINQNITLPTTSTTITGTATDPDGTVVSTLWTQTLGPVCTITSPSALSTTITGMVAGTYVFKLTATDNLSRQGSDTITIIVSLAANILPIANIDTPNLTITLPTNSVVLAGSGSDADGVIVSYLWTKISGPSTYNIVSPTLSTTTINNLVAGTYQFQLQVTDNRGGTGVHTTNVTVNPAPNVLPVANAGGNKIVQLPTTSITLNGSGTDADGTITGYLWTQVSGPNTATIGNSTLATSTMSGLVFGTYVFRLRVTDNRGGQHTNDTTIMVKADNIRPTANAGLDQNLTNATSITLTGLATPFVPGGGTIASTTWTLSSSTISVPGIIITTPNSTTTTVTNIGIIGNTYIFTLTVVDSFGNSVSDSCTVINNAVLLTTPIVEAGANQTVSPPTLQATLSGSATDTDGTIISHSWSQVSGPNTAIITTPSLYITTVTGLVPGTYLFMLLATDNDAQTGSDGVYITVTPNQLPIANAGLDKTITLPINSVIINGSGTDSDGTIITYKWVYFSGPATYNISNSNIASPTITFSSAGVYEFTLTVTDNLGGQGTDRVKVTVNAAPNQLPTANAGLDQTVQLPTSSTTLIGSGTDSDGTIASYAWTRVSGPNTPTIVSATSATTSITGLIAGTYVFGLTVTDNVGGVSPQDLVTVIVLAVPNVLPIANANVNQTITLPTNSATLSGSGTDSDGTIVSYLWTKLAGSPSGGAITSATSASTTVTGLIAGVYTYQLQVTDNSGGTGIDTMTITVNAAPPPPIPLAKIALQSNPTVPVTTTTITLPTASVALIDATFSPGYPAVAWLWTRISGPAGSTITTPTAQSTTITGLVQGTYVFQLQSTIAPPWNYQSSIVPPECRITVTVNPTAPASNIYYISPTGDNTRTATQAKNINTPWKTLSHACTNVSTAGSIIHILPGTYNETAQCNLKVGVSIEGEGVISNIVSTYNGIAINLNSNTDGTNGNQSVSNFKLSGSNLTGKKGIMVQSRSNVKVFNMTIQDFEQDGILFKGAISGGQPSVYATGNELYNCIITNNSTRYGGQGNVVATGFRGMLIHDNIITQMSRAGNQNGNIYSATAEGWSEGLKFYNNKTYRNTYDENEWAFHVEMWNSQGGMELYNNEFHGWGSMIDLAGEEAGTGIIKGTYPYAAYVHDNLFDMGVAKSGATAYLDKGITIEGNVDGVIISNNHFKNMPYGIEITGVNSTTFMKNILIKNNLFESGGYTASTFCFDIDILTYCADIHCVDITDVQIYNNTFSSPLSEAALFIYMNAGTTVRRIEFTNNIVKDVRNYGYVTFFTNDGIKSNFTIKNNLLYQNANSNAISLQSGATLPTSSTITGNIIANPLLNAAFHPQVGSPAINAGINVGIPFNGVAPDIGFFET